MNSPEIILRFFTLFDNNDFILFAILHMIPKFAFFIHAAHSNIKFTSLKAICYESVAHILLYAPLTHLKHHISVSCLVLTFNYEYLHLFKAAIASFFLKDFEYVIEFFSLIQKS